MIDIKELDTQTMAKAKIMASEMGITLDMFFQVIDNAKQEFFKKHYFS